MNNRSVHRGLWILAALWFWAGPVLAECPEVDRELETTRLLLDRRREQLDECRVPHARGLVEQAERALRDAAKRSRVRQCRRAGLQVEAAKGLLERAARLCAETDRRQDQVLEFLNDTDALLERTLDEAEVWPQECRRLLSASRDQQQNAWRQFRAKKPRFALNLSSMCRRTLETARQCLSDGGVGPQVERELERTDQWLERVQSMLPDRGSDGLRRAADMQKRAWDRHRDGRARQAMMLTLQARRTVVGELAAAEDGTPSDRVGALLQAARDFVAEVAAGPGELDRRQRRQLNQAADRLDEAEARLRRGDVSAALVSMRGALALALEASEFRGPGGRR